MPCSGCGGNGPRYSIQVGESFDDGAGGVGRMFRFLESRSGAEGIFNLYFSGLYRGQVQAVAGDSPPEAVIKAAYRMA